MLGQDLHVGSSVRRSESGSTCEGTRSRSDRVPGRRGKGYTIDIQLTELSFPDLFRNEKMGVKKSAALNLNSACTPGISPDSQASSSPSPSRHGSPVVSHFCHIQTSSPTSMETPSQEDDSIQPSPSGDTDTSAHTGMQLKPQTHIHRDSTDLNKVKPELIYHNSSSTAGLICKQDPEEDMTVSHPVGRDGEKHSSATGKEEAENTRGNSNVTEGDSEESETDSGVTEDSNVPEEDVDEEDECDEQEEGTDLDASEESSGEHRCRVCDVTLPSAFGLREHMHLHSGTRPYRCSECGKQFCHLANYRTHLRSHAKATAIRCRVCEAYFQSIEGLQTHLETSHLENEFYQCDYCKRIFTCFNECQRHVEMHRLNLVQHQCPQCGRHFRRQKSLTHHLEHHNRHRTFLCTDCGQSFPKKTILFRHSFSHLGLLPYTCIHCQRHFRLASLYRKHKCKPERIQCVACLGFFHSQRDFQRHKKETGCWGHQGAKDNEIRCMECGQAFGSVEELKKHAGAHQRVLTCSECGKGFRSSLLLMSHMGGHASQRPYLCQRCGLGFPHQQAYESHQKDCGRETPVQRLAKKPKKTEPAAKADPPVKTPVWNEKSVLDTKDVWHLTLDKMPPPGAVLVMYLPFPTSSSNPLGATLSKAVPADNELKGKGPPVAIDLSTGKSLPTETSPLGHSGPALQLTGPGHTVGPAAMQFAEIQQPLLTLSSARDQTNVDLPDASVATVHPHAASLTVLPSQIPTETFKPPVAAEGTRADVSRTADEAGHPQKSTTVLGCTGIQIGAGETEEALPSSKGEMGMVIKMENKRFTNNVQSEAVLNFSKVKEKACATHTDCLESETCGAWSSDSLVPIKCEGGPAEGFNRVQEDDSQGRRGTLEDNKDGGTRGFDCVEVEIWDDMKGEGEMEDEPHECINCGQILLDGNLLEHYMQHAAASDSPFPKVSAKTRPGPRLRSCPLYRSRRQKSRKKR